MSIDNDLPDEDEDATNPPAAGAPPTAGLPANSPSAEITERMNETNRILLEARMLPRGQKLTEEQIQSVREAVHRHITRSGITMSRVAREVNYKPAVLSEFFASKYTGSNTKVAHALNDWMERDARREQASRPSGYVKTWVAETMQTVAQQADKQGLMAAMVVPAGAGKSMVMEILAEQMRGIYIYCDPNISERELLYKIAVAAGYKNKIASKPVMRQFIVEEMTGTRRPILLDEAQNLRKAIAIVRSIYDQAKVAIIMAGTAEIMEYIDDRSDGRGQFSSRTLRFNAMEAIRTVESGPGGGNRAGRDLFNSDEVKQFLASKNIRMSTDGLRMMHLLACLPNHGTLRLVEKLAGIAVDLNRKEFERTGMLCGDHVMEALELFCGASGAAYLVKTIDRYESLYLKVG